MALGDAGADMGHGHVTGEQDSAHSAPAAPSVRCQGIRAAAASALPPGHVPRPGAGLHSPGLEGAPWGPQHQVLAALLALPSTPTPAAVPQDREGASGRLSALKSPVLSAYTLEHRSAKDRGSSGEGKACRLTSAGVISQLSVVLSSEVRDLPALSREIG